MKMRDLTVSTRKPFVKLNPGESLVGVFRGEIYEFRRHWSNADKKSIPCPGRATCPLCATGENSTFRFRANFMVYENGAYAAKVFEGGANMYKQLYTLNQEYGLTKHAVKVTRMGAGTQTTYQVMPAANGAVTAEVEKALSQVALNQLADESEDQENVA